LIKKREVEKFKGANKKQKEGKNNINIFLLIFSFSIVYLKTFIIFFVYLFYRVHLGNSGIMTRMIVSHVQQGDIAIQVVITHVLNVQMDKNQT
jgi:hypothetical protein